MKRILAGLAMVAATAVLSGCYYDPGYSYVRPVTTYGGGDAYYGNGVAYDNGYYGYPGYYYPGYYGYYGCCYAPLSIGIGGVWYGGSRYHGRDGYYGRGGYWHGHSGGGGRGGWGGHHGH